MNGKLVHSKKVQYQTVELVSSPNKTCVHSMINEIFFLNTNICFLQEGSGFVDNEQKMATLVDAIDKVLGK